MWLHFSCCTITKSESLHVHSLGFTIDIIQCIETTAVDLVSVWDNYSSSLYSLKTFSENIKDGSQSLQNLVPTFIDITNQSLCLKQVIKEIMVKMAT